MSKTDKKAKHKSKKRNAHKATQIVSDSTLKQADSLQTNIDERIIESEGQWVAYDENLLECSRTQWQFGDWQSLARLDRGTLQHHPDRAKLALLAAAGHLQLGATEEARQYLTLAQEWGCSSRLISQVLIAGVHNSLGRAAAILGQEQSALKHFSHAIALGTPGGDARLLAQARMMQQYIQLGHPMPLLENGSTLTNTKETSNNGEG